MPEGKLSWPARLVGAGAGYGVLEGVSVYDILRRLGYPLAEESSLRRSLEASKQASEGNYFCITNYLAFGLFRGTTLSFSWSKYY